MQEYAKICLLVSVFAAVREFRPIEPFFTAFLTSPAANLTNQDVREQVYPYGTYSCLAQVIVVFLVTDYLRYKPMIVLGSVAGCSLYALLLEHPPLWRIKISQLLFGLFSAAHVAYFSYMYARIEDKRLYQKVTGYARASLLVGKFLNGLVAQLCISYGILQYEQLLYLSIAGTVVTLLISLFFPPVKHSTYFHKKKFKTDQKVDYDVIRGNSDSRAPDDVQDAYDTGDNSHRESLTECTKNDSVTSHLWHDFKTAFSNPIVIKWASWLVFAKGCHFLVLTYNQILWQTVAKEQKTVPLMNGAVEAISTITSAGAAYIVARMSSDWRKGHSTFLFLSCICCSALLFYCGLSTNLWTVYIAYIAYSFIFQSTLTVTESQIAQNIQRDSYALVFGFLNFLAFSLTSLFTVFVIQHSFLREKPTAHQQFEIYGVILFVLAGVVAFESVVTSCRQRSSGPRDAHTTA
ncbi:thiamine transporter 2 [Bemisia tabaci]